MATSNFMIKVYNDRFATEFSVSMLKETTMLVRDYVSETRKLCTNVYLMYFCEMTRVK